MRLLTLSAMRRCGDIIYQSIIPSRLRRRRYAASITTSPQTAGLCLRENLVAERTQPLEATYEICGNKLDSGSYGTCYKMVHKRTGMMYAVKVIDLEGALDKKKYDREIDILRQIDHPNVVRLFETFHTDYALHLVMELCSGGNLREVLHRTPNNLDERQAAEYINQIIQAVAHCHGHGICHRDIKLENILLENVTPSAQLKLIDFGLAVKFKRKARIRGHVGSLYTMAPEVLHNMVQSKEYDQMCDLWSVGVVSYLILSGQEPFDGIHLTDACDNTNLIANVMMGRYHFDDPIWQGISQDAQHFISALLQVDPNERMSANEALSHPWILKTTQKPGFQRMARVRIANNLDRLRACSDFQRTVMATLAFEMPNNKQVHNWRTYFQSMDKDKDGLVSKQEFKNTMLLLYPSLSDEVVESIFNLIDQDKNQQLSYNEFLAVMVDPREVNIKQMNQAFLRLDIDRKGFITTEDLRRVMRVKEEEENHAAQNAITLPSPSLELRIQQIIEAADVNNDGIVSYSEFLFAMSEKTTNSDDSPRQELACQSASIKRTRKSEYEFPQSPVLNRFERARGLVRGFSDGLLVALDPHNSAEEVSYDPKCTTAAKARTLLRRFHSRPISDDSKRQRSVMLWSAAPKLRLESPPSRPLVGSTLHKNSSPRHGISGIVGRLLSPHSKIYPCDSMGVQCGSFTKDSTEQDTERESTGRTR